PSLVKSSWTPEEDAFILRWIKDHGRIKWSLVQEHVPTRTDVQCRERWTGVLDPGIKTGPWTEEEDAALMAAMGPHWQENGFNEWARLTAVLPGRT
ncbi:predicted protein, partial [Ostreococcus lucimarinus CCE9901]